MSHFKAKMQPIRFPASVRPFVCALDWLWHIAWNARPAAC